MEAIRSRKVFYHIAANTILFCFLIGLRAAILAKPIPLLLSELSEALYVPHTNLFLNPEPVNTLFLAYLALAMISGHLIEAATNRSRNVRSFPIFLSAGLSAFLLVFLLQGIGQMRHFSKEFALFSGKTIEQKIATRFQRSYSRATFCKGLLPGKPVVKPLTGLDLRDPVQQLTYFSFRYYLLPINFAQPGGQKEIDVLVAFFKKSPENCVPKSYKILGSFEKENLVAIKK